MQPAYWRGAAEDEAMQDEHGFLWLALLDTVDIDLAGKRVLDAGCNRGGFLRLVADRYAIDEGCGYDPASGAIDDASQLTGGRPLRFTVGETVPPSWTGFDVAFSHEVIYLLHDLEAHARAVFGALRPGGVYYAVVGVHAGSPLMAEWHAGARRELDLPELRDLDAVVTTFESVGFDAAVSRLAVRFVPTSAHRHGEQTRLMDWLRYYYEEKVVLRFNR
jgi:SAM-dependent methyltransferase